VAITDCLEMDAISRGVGVAEGAVRALVAGADLVLISHLIGRQMAGLSAARDALRSGRIDPARVREALERLRRLKQRRLSWDGALSPAPVTSSLAETTALREEAYARSMTVARDDARLLPLRLEPGQRLVVLDWPVTDVTRAVDVPYSSEPFVGALRERYGIVDVVALPEETDRTGIERVRQRLRVAGATIALTLNAHLDPARLSPLRDLLGGAGNVIGVAVCNPYDAAALPTIPSYLLTYDYSAPALRAAANVVTGARHATGKCPVTLAPE
jgi:beta-N-acetylhexosaminidase